MPVAPKQDQSSSFEYSLCLDVEGLLKKKNSHGQWKDRYAQFQNGFFLTYKPKGSKPSSELKESIDLKDLENATIKSDVLEMELKNGDILIYKGNKLKEWHDAMKSRAKRAQELYQKSLSENVAKGVHIAGWLQKKSHNKYQGFQVKRSILI